MCRCLKMLVMTLLIVGGLNWGLVGTFDMDLVYYLFGRSMISRVIYLLFGFAALFKLFWFMKCGFCCRSK